MTLQNGEQLVNGLDFYSDKSHEYSYRLKTENAMALATSPYSISVLVKPGNAANTCQAARSTDCQEISLCVIDQGKLCLVWDDKSPLHSMHSRRLSAHT